MSVVDRGLREGWIPEGGPPGELAGLGGGDFGATAGYHRFSVPQPKSPEGAVDFDTGMNICGHVFETKETLATIAIATAIGAMSWSGSYELPTPVDLLGGLSTKFSLHHQPRRADASARPETGFEVTIRPYTASPSAAWRAFKELGQWLGLDDPAVADAIGIGRTTAYSWRRVGHEPRRSTARRLFEMHSVLGALRRRLGVEGFEGWLAGGVPAHHQKIAAGELEDLQAEVDQRLFAGGPPAPDLSWTVPDRETVDPIGAAEAPRPGPRKARRYRQR
jgi:hypothetical protein